MGYEEEDIVACGGVRRKKSRLKGDPTEIRTQPLGMIHHVNMGTVRTEGGYLLVPSGYYKKDVTITEAACPLVKDTLQ